MRKRTQLWCYCLSLLVGSSGVAADEIRQRWELVSPTAGALGELTVVDDGAVRTLLIMDNLGTKLLLSTGAVKESRRQMVIRDLIGGGELTVSAALPRGKARGREPQWDFDLKSEVRVEANLQRQSAAPYRLKGEEKLRWTMNVRKSLDSHFKKSIELLRDLSPLEELRPFCAILDTVSYAPVCGPRLHGIERIEQPVDCDRDARLGIPCRKRA